MSDATHWNTVYASKSHDSVSWYQRHPTRSLAFIEALALAPADPIIDVGAGASSLADALIARGRRDITLNDIAAAALDQVRARLSAHSDALTLSVGDITTLALPTQHYALWHDRAVFHFLTEAPQRSAYVDAASHAIRAQGHLLVATFAADGPQQCSGLPVCRYDADALAAVFAPRFRLIDAEREAHTTPAGTTQWFQYTLLQRM